MPSKIFESFAMGIPVLIGVPRGEATMLVEKSGAGIVFEPEDAESLASAIVRLFTDVEMRKSLVVNCHAAARKYDRNQLVLDM